jgi:hypothetical protein
MTQREMGHPSVFGFKRLAYEALQRKAGITLIR